MPQGIDVYSAYQHVTSWAKVKAHGIDFAYIKLTDGTAKRDEAGYTRGAQSAGVKAGGYHYAEPGNAAAQADLFIDTCERYGCTDLAPALDLEDPFVPGNAARSFAITFLRRVQARGHRPCLYANNSMMSSVAAGVLAAVPHTLLWVARYGANPTVKYHVWQYSDKGQVPGISASAVDLNTGIVPLNSGATNATTPSPPPPQQIEDDAMFLACKGFDPKYPAALMYAIYSGGVITGLSAESVKNGLLASYYKDKIVWLTAKDMQALARKSEGVTGGAK